MHIIRKKMDLLIFECSPFYCVVFLALILLPALALPANDWGIQLDTSADVYNSADENYFSCSGTLIPWFSAPVGTAHLYLSGGFTAEYIYKTFNPIPELLRTELSFPVGSDGKIKAGRMLYDDPLGIIANGLFDGAAFSLDSAAGIFNAGIWYTGLLYKKNTKIAMTDGDLASYEKKLDYKDFAATYFAPRRLVFALDWGNPDLSELLRLKFAFIGQCDLSGREDVYHSQYLAAKAAIPVKSFAFDMAGCLELAEKGASGQCQAALAGELGIGWIPPTSIKDRLTLTVRLSSGKSDNGALGAFIPVTTEEQDDILKANFSGLSMIRLSYTARPHESFLFGLASSYFILSDSETYKGLPAGRDGRGLGNEFSGRLSWSPVSDLRLSLGGGVFLPSWGNADRGGKALWRVEVNAALVIF